MKAVIVTGGTGYLGRPLLRRLSAAGFSVKAIVRLKSLFKVPSGCEPMIGDVLDAGTYARALPAGAVFIHLVGVAHPAPWKSERFRNFDLAALRQSALAAKQSGASHFIFVSVAQPAPAMGAYVQVRRECEAILRESGMSVTILRPWYVLGPGHRWPYLLIPAYKVLERFPATRGGAVRLGLVTREQMVAALFRAVELGASGVRVWETAQIRGAEAA